MKSTRSEETRMSVLDDQWERRFAHIDPRSAYLLAGPVRNRWQHSIAHMDVLRYSVTLRSFRPGHGSRDQPLSDAACAAVLDQHRLDSASVTGEDAGSRSVSF
jgi:hypothetical protein